MDYFRAQVISNGLYIDLAQVSGMEPQVSAFRSYDPESGAAASFFIPYSLSHVYLHQGSPSGKCHNY
jgi:hypothetical protein